LIDTRPRHPIVPKFLSCYHLRTSVFVVFSLQHFGFWFTRLCSTFLLVKTLYQPIGTPFKDTDYQHCTSPLTECSSCKFNLLLQLFSTTHYHQNYYHHLSKRNAGCVRFLPPRIYSSHCGPNLAWIKQLIPHIWFYGSTNLLVPFWQIMLGFPFL